MQDNHAAPAHDGDHQSAVPPVTPRIEPTPVTTVGPDNSAASTQHRSSLSSPVTWLSLATLLVVVIVYLFLAPIPAATQVPVRETVPAQR